MAHTPTECAHYLLRVFPAFNSRADECLRQNSFMKPFAENGWRADDYNVGIELCVKNEWVKIGPNGGICVTQAGLDEIGA
jgi:hypothetical protein